MGSVQNGISVMRKTAREGAVPSSVRYDGELDLSDIVFYAEVSARVGDNGICNIDCEALEEYLHLSRQTMIDGLKRLSERGYIEVIEHQEECLFKVRITSRWGATL